MRPLPIEALAGVPFVLGASIVRGAPVPVVDVAALLGLEAGEASRFVIVRAGGRRVALLVDAVMDVAALPPEASAAMPPLLAGVSEAATALGRLDRALLVVLDTARVVPA